MIVVAALAALWAPTTANAQLAPPRAVITAGPEGEVPETSATFEFESDGFSPFGRFECRLDGAAWATCSSPHEITGLGGGPHAFEVRLQGALTDPEPARREWIVAQRTEVLPCGGKPCASPLPDPPAVPPPPPPARPDRRRDARGCAYGGNEPGEASAVRLRRAVRCLVDIERARRELPTLKRDRRLERAAGRHARDMVARGYFAHASPGGAQVTQRVRAAGYLRGTRYWSVGEVLAWLIRPRPTPVAIVDAWMDSKPHRKVLLHPAFREIGAAFARGNPRGDRGAGATFAAVLGRRALRG